MQSVTLCVPELPDSPAPILAEQFGRKLGLFALVFGVFFERASLAVEARKSRLDFLKIFLKTVSFDNWL